MTASRTPIEMPNNPQAEQGLLGALLVDNPAFEKVCDFLRPEHFYAPANGRIYDAICKLRAKGQPVTPVILKKSFEADDDLSEIGGAEYIADLAASVVTVMNVAEHGRHIFDLFQRREEIAVFQAAIDSAMTVDHDKSAVDIASEVEAGLYRIAEGSTERDPAVPFSTAISEAIGLASAAHRGEADATGISSGLTELTKLIGGFQPSDLVIVAGRPSMGKTALATGMAWYAAALGKKVAFFSLEMSRDQLATRIMASAANVQSNLIRRGALNQSQFQKLMAASQSLAALPLYISDTAGQTMLHIRSASRRLKRTHGLDMIVVDYLQLIRSPGKSRSDGRVQELSEITVGLKNLAKEFGVPVIALSQLSRAVEQRDDKRPQLSDLRESGSIEQDADMVMFVYRDEYYLERAEPTNGNQDGAFSDRYQAWADAMLKAKNKAEIIVGKQRHGPIGTATVHFQGDTTTFSDLAPEYQERRAY